MRFVYGVILGFLATVVGVILYLALGGGEYLLVLSPTYHGMKSRLEVLEKAEQQRDELARRLAELERRFQELARRFEDVTTMARPSGDTGAPEGAEVTPTDEPTPATP